MTSNSALKRLRQSEKRRQKNRAVKSEIKTQTKKVLTAVEAKSKDTAVVELKKTSSILDKAVRKGVIVKNTASRRKSRLAAQVNRLS